MFKLLLAISMISLFVIPEIVSTYEILTSVAESLKQLGY